MKDPTTRVRLIPGHAGRGGTQKRIITLHIQEGNNDLFPEFANRPPATAADSTMWCKRDGSLERFLNDTDTPWTNGDVVAPDLTNPIIAQMIKEGVKNTNRYAYTIEHQGFYTEQFPAVQIEATAQMCAYWMDKEGWGPDEVDDRITGHYQVGNHKNCPGPNFPWAKLRARVASLLGKDLPLEVKPTLPLPFDPNPQKKIVGAGVVEVASKDNLTAITDEQYFTANSSKLGQRSFTYVQNSAGETFQVEAVQQVDGNGKPTGPWKRELWRLEKSYD
jgi:hypothetical protein